MRRQELRRFGFDTLLLHAPQGPASAPASPAAGALLENVHEEDEHEPEEQHSESDSELTYTREEDVFGVAALNMRRHRQIAGMDALNSFPSGSASSLL